MQPLRSFAGGWRLLSGICVILMMTLFGCAAGPSGPPEIAAAAAEHQQCSRVPSAPADLIGQHGYRQVVISVYRQGNLPPPKLTLANLRLHQDSKPVPVAYLQPVPVTVGILVDNSGSMRPKLPGTREALTSFLRDLDSGDEIFIYTFTDRPQMIASLSTDHGAGIDRLSVMHAYGRTALYDTIIDGLRTAAKGCNKDKALLVLTDGMDTSSHSASLSSVIEEARKGSVPIYSIGIGLTKTAVRSSGFGPFIFGGGSDLDRVDTKTLNELAAQTGGETFFVILHGQDNSLAQAVTAIAARLDSRYTVGFIGDGSAANLRFEVPGVAGVSLSVKPD